MDYVSKKICAEDIMPGMVLEYVGCRFIVTSIELVSDSKVRVNSHDFQPILIDKYEEVKCIYPETKPTCCCSCNS